MTSPSGLKHYVWIDYMIVPDLEACHSVFSLYANTHGSNTIPDWLLDSVTLFDIQAHRT